MMPRPFDIGENSILADNAGNIITLAINKGDSVVVTNVAGSTLNVYGNGPNGVTSTIAATGNATFTQATYIQSQGRTSCTISGGCYGG